MTIHFADKAVAYDTFLNDLAARLLGMMKQQRNDPEYVSQRTAYKMFGRANVQRWVQAGKLHPSKRPGKVEYPMRELRLQQAVQQDYL